MLRRILSLVLNSKKKETPIVEHPTTVESDSLWTESGGDPNDWEYGMRQVIQDAQKIKAKQIDDYIFQDYEEN